MTPSWDTERPIVRAGDNIFAVLGFPAEEHIDPELERHHWEVRSDISDVVFTR